MAHCTYMYQRGHMVEVPYQDRLKSLNIVFIFANIYCGYFIWVFAVFQSTRLGVSSIQRPRFRNVEYLARKPKKNSSHNTNSKFFSNFMPIYLSSYTSREQQDIADVQLRTFLNVNLLLFSYQSILTYVLGAQKNREAILFSTHNIYLVEK